MDYAFSASACSIAGNLLLGGILTLSLVAIFLLSPLGGENGKRNARISAICAAVLAALAGLELMWLIFANRFDIAYVAGYSSMNLPTLYKISVFWAGQQGSFLLWLIIHALAGGYLAKKQTSSSVLASFMFLEALLTVLTLGQSPFTPSPNLLADGVGLNPLLMDPWMAIHPPIIFIGYALLAVPLAYSLGALISSPESNEWLKDAERWALLAWAFLGAGIFVGGYWAYKVLGWGGYWGWDPVENASLVPWLLTLVFIHVSKVARTRPGALIIAHLAVIFTFSLVLYGSFLTRSGVLGDFSVHAFSDVSVGMSLAVANALVLIGSLSLLTWRAAKMPQGALYDTLASREYAMLLGMLFSVFIAALVFFGMSMPLFTKILGQSAAVDTAFYTRTTLPLGVFLMLTMLAASYMSLKKHSLSLGGKIAHGGAALAFVAMLISGYGGQTTIREMTVGEHCEVFGHDIVYNGQEFLSDGSAKYYVYTVDGETYRALTKLRANGADAAREPAIAKTVCGDIYIAPTPPENYGVSELVLSRRAVAMDGELAYRLDDAVISGSGQVSATVSVTDGNTVEACTLEMTMTERGRVSNPVNILNGSKRLRLTGVTEDMRRIRLEILPPIEEMSNIPVTASIASKPFIWWLWLGCFMVTAGCLLSVKPFKGISKNRSFLSFSCLSSFT